MGNAIDTLIKDSIFLSRPSQFADELIGLCINEQDIVKSRAMSLRTLMSSNLAVFNAFFESLEQYSLHYPSIAKIKNPLTKVELEVFEQINRSRLLSATSIDRLERREREFLNSLDQLNENEQVVKIFWQKLAHNLSFPFKFKLEKLLFEVVLPSYSYTGSSFNWHIDNLKDQIKVFVPFHDVKAEEGAMVFFPNTELFETLPLEMKSKIMNIFSLVNDKTSVLNHLESYIVQALSKGGTFEHLTLNRDEIAIFNSRVIHSGSQVKSTPRYGVTFYLNVESKRNRILNCFNE